MAKKRRLKVSSVPEQNEEEDELPHRFKNIGWKEWFKVDFARYWFVVIALAINVLFGLEVMNAVSGEGVLGIVIFLVIAIPSEIFIYLYLWGEKGILTKEQ